MHVSTLCEFYNKRNAKLTDLEIVGDMHGSASTRVMIESNNERVIATTSEWRTSSAFCEFLTTLDADFKHLLPTWTFKNQIYQRPYITPEQNTSSKETIREYFFYLWKLLPYILQFRGVDINQENVIATLPYPIFNDLECLFLPQVNIDEWYWINYSWYVDDSVQNNASLLYGGDMQKMSYLVPILSGTADYPRIKWTVPSRSKQFSTPYLNWKISLIKDYSLDFMKWYSDGMRWLTKNMWLVRQRTAEQNLQVRVLLRPTAYYRSRLMHALVHTTMFDTDFIASLESSLSTNIVVACDEIDREHEVDLLSQAVIPSYYADIHSQEIYSEDGKQRGLLKESPYDTYISMHTNAPNFLNQQEALLKKMLEIN